MGRRLVAIDLGPRMHHDVRRAAFGQRRGTDQRAVRAIEAQAHLGGDGDVFRHRAAHVFDDFVEQFRLLEQHRPAPGFIHGLGWATEIQVDHLRAQLTGQRRVFRQAHRIGAEQLHPQRHAGSGLGTGQQLRGELMEIGRREQTVVDADELGDTPVDPANTGQDIPQDVVDQPSMGARAICMETHTQRKNVRQFTGFCPHFRHSPQIPVGAGLLAKAVGQLALTLNGLTLSRASSLPQWFQGVHGIGVRHNPLWERACSRKRWISLH